MLTDFIHVHDYADGALIQEAPVEIDLTVQSWARQIPPAILVDAAFAAVVKARVFNYRKRGLNWVSALRLLRPVDSTVIFTEVLPSANPAERELDAPLLSQALSTTLVFTCKVRLHACFPFL